MKDYAIKDWNVDQKKAACGPAERMVAWLIIVGLILVGAMP